MMKQRASSIDMGKLWKYLIVLLGIFPLMAWAEPDVGESPSLELLEFLGNWETEDGEWLDPIQLLEELEAESQTAEVEDGSDG